MIQSEVDLIDRAKAPVAIEAAYYIEHNDQDARAFLVADPVLAPLTSADRVAYPGVTPVSVP